MGIDGIFKASPRVFRSGKALIMPESKKKLLYHWGSGVYPAVLHARPNQTTKPAS